MSNTRDGSDDRPVRGRGWKFMAGFVISGLGLGLAVVGLNPGATSLAGTFSDTNAGIVTGIGIGICVCIGISISIGIGVGVGIGVDISVGIRVTTRYAHDHRGF